jgi:Tat protein translocase TatB subunit
MNLGPAEILVVLFVALMVFGPKRLPDVARQVGGAMRELRKMQDNVKAELHGVMNPDLGPSQTVDNTPPVEEPDHTALPSPTVEQPVADATDDPFGGPPGSFS